MNIGAAPNDAAMLLDITSATFDMLASTEDALPAPPPRTGSGNSEPGFTPLNGDLDALLLSAVPPQGGESRGGSVHAARPPEPG